MHRVLGSDLALIMGDQLDEKQPAAFTPPGRIWFVEQIQLLLSRRYGAQA
jgi:hypothetical protein